MKMKLYDKVNDPYLKQREKNVENYYNQVLDRDDGYKLLIKINKHFTEENVVNRVNNSHSLEPIGDKSRQLYFRIRELDSLDLSDKMFKNEMFAEELKELSAFYYYTLKIINTKLYYRYDTKKMVMFLNKHEEMIYSFYDSIIELFINKTDSFFEKKIYKYLQDEDYKKLVKNNNKNIG